MKEKLGSFWVFLTLLAVSSSAQTWHGDEAVAVQVHDAKRRPVVDARVVFTFQGVPGETGPDVVASDAKGRAVLADLAPGPWQVEISHPDYLSYIAMVDIRRGKKPLVSASFLEAGGRSLSPVKVKFSKADRQQASPVLEARLPGEPARPVTPTVEESAVPSPQVAEVPAAEPGAQPSPLEPAIEPVPEPESQTPPERKPETAPSVAEPEPTPEAVVEAELEEPVSEPEPQISTIPAEAEATRAVEPIPEPVVEPAPVESPPRVPEVPAEGPSIEAPALSSPAPEPVPEPLQAPEVEQAMPEAEPLQPSPDPEPAPLPMTTAPEAVLAAEPPPPDPGARITSHTDGSCGDCESAEWTLQVSVGAPALDPTSAGRCGPEVIEAARAAMRGLSASIQLELDGFIGPVANGTPQGAIRRVEPDLAEPFSGELAAFVDGRSPCQVVALVLPKAVRFSRLSLAAADQNGMGNCAPGQVCSIGDAAWLGSALVERGPSATIVYGLFENRSPDRGRRAFLTAYYRPPNANWKPRLPAAD